MVRTLEIFSNSLKDLKDLAASGLFKANSPKHSSSTQKKLDQQFRATTLRIAGIAAFLFSTFSLYLTAVALSYLSITVLPFAFITTAFMALSNDLWQTAHNISRCCKQRSEFKGTLLFCHLSDLL